MFRTTPTLTPDQFRWLKELGTQRVAARCLPAAVRDQLVSLNYITAPDDGLARMTGHGQRAIGSHVAP
ncbi:MAG: hypothetical protein EON54_19740 [Alcaligenaceae bacterium]|nr:MAG: hypothetical protein EON54_19740 [Alcaligenaceae bacterium]